MNETIQLCLGALKNLRALEVTQIVAIYGRDATMDEITVRTILEAMRAPSDAMLDAGALDFAESDSDALTVYRAMIDAALKS